MKRKTSPHYWRAFRNLEDDILALSDNIHFDDCQISTYSFHIADLIFRCLSEYEAIFKDLYRLSVKEDVANDDSSNNKIGSIINHFNKEWQLEDKQVALVPTNMFFHDDFQGYFSPLNYENKSAEDFYHQYNAIKHDRVKNINKATVKTLLLAAAGLYLMNIYYYGNEFNELNPSTLFVPRIAGVSIGFSMDYEMDLQPILRKCPIFKHFSSFEYWRYREFHGKEVNELFNLARKKLDEDALSDLLSDYENNLPALILRLVEKTGSGDVMPGMSVGNGIINKTNSLIAGYLNSMSQATSVNYGYHYIYTPRTKMDLERSKLMELRIADQVFSD